MQESSTLVLGASGRIGQVLRHVWGRDGTVLWQSRRHHDGPGWAVFPPLEDPAALAVAAAGRQILCLAGSVPHRGADLADNRRLALAAVRAAGRGGRVLLASSAAVYGAQPGCLTEDTPLKPVSEYGAAKADMERSAAREAELRGVRLCALRIGNIAGLDASLGGWHPRYCLDRFPGGATPRRSYIGAKILAQLLAALLRRSCLPPTLNIAQPGTVEMCALLRAAGLPFTLRAAAAQAISLVELDTRRLSACLPAGLLRPADPSEMAREWAGLKQHVMRGQAG